MFPCSYDSISVQITLLRYRAPKVLVLAGVRLENRGGILDGEPARLSAGSSSPKLGIG